MDLWGGTYPDVLSLEFIPHIPYIDAIIQGTYVHTCIHTGTCVTVFPCMLSMICDDGARFLSSLQSI